MKHMIFCVVCMIGTACSVESTQPSPAPSEGEASQAVADPNICQPGSANICTGRSIGEVCSNPARCFPWFEQADGTYLCSCSTEPLGLSNAR